MRRCSRGLAVHKRGSMEWTTLWADEEPLRFARLGNVKLFDWQSMSLARKANLHSTWHFDHLFSSYIQLHIYTKWWMHYMFSLKIALVIRTALWKHTLTFTDSSLSKEPAFERSTNLRLFCSCGLWSREVWNTISGLVAALIGLWYPLMRYRGFFEVSPFNGSGFTYRAERAGRLNKVSARA